MHPSFSSCMSWSHPVPFQFARSFEIIAVKCGKLPLKNIPLPLSLVTQKSEACPCPSSPLLLQGRTRHCPKIKQVDFSFCCTFAVHELFGFRGSKFQSLYHFTVGGPVLDKRIMSLPAYPGPGIDA